MARVAHSSVRSPRPQTLLRPSGRERGRLAKFDHFDVGRGATMIVLELGDQSILGVDDGGGALRELIHQTLRDPGHFPLRGGAGTPGVGLPVPAEFAGQ